MRLTYLLLFAGLPLAAQSLQELSFCPAGIHPDGFVSWSQLPPATQQTTATYAIPVAGGPGLTATITIQKTGSGVDNPAPLYRVVNSADLSVNSISGTPVIVTFSSPVKGASVVFSAYGRFLHGFHMIANDTSGNTTDVPPPAEVDSSALEEGESMVYQSPLQIESNAANLTSVSFGFDGDTEENAAFDLINFRVDSGTQPDPSATVPIAGLAAWFRADSTPLSTWALGGSVSVNTWTDALGRAATVTPGYKAPMSIVAGRNCTQVLSFDGVSGLQFNLPINGWPEMTIVIAAQAYYDGSGSSNAALFWNDAQPWGETFVSPFQSSVWFRFGTREPGNQPLYHRPVNAGGDFQVITTTHVPGVDSLFVNSVLVQQSPGRYSLINGATTTVTIGQGYHGLGFIGNIGEILIYNHALMPTQREKVEQYLMAKFGT